MVGLNYAVLLIHEIKDISLSLDILSRNSEAVDVDMYPSYLHPPISIDLAKRSHHLGWIWLRVAVGVQVDRQQCVNQPISGVLLTGHDVGMGRGFRNQQSPGR